tara:strand:- start:34 stop:453 length:420 start_codon:yes stop_codon:yes gene_type:complete
MLKFTEVFSFTRINLYINIVVLFFFIIFLKPKQNTYTIQDNNFHTHCIKSIITEEASRYIDLENDERHVHREDPIIKYNIKGHTHDMGETAKMYNMNNNNRDNIYEAKYERHLEYLLKGFVVIAVLISTVVLNVNLLKD